MGSERPKFVADCMLGTLAKWLRLAGFDVAYLRDADDDDLVRLAVRENRCLLTKDNLLAGRRILRGRTVLVEQDGSAAQMREVLGKLSLNVDPAALFTRCIVCNAPIEPVPKESVRAIVPPHVFRTKREFGRCTECGKVYWRGSHVDHIVEALEDELAANE